MITPKGDKYLIGLGGILINNFLTEIFVFNFYYNMIIYK